MVFQICKFFEVLQRIRMNAALDALEIQESPDINGVTFAKSKRQCFYKIKMVNIAVSQDHETCFLSSKSMLVSIKTVLPRCFSQVFSLGPEVF